MVNKPKQRGTAAESAVVSFLRTAGFPYAERLALQGGKDRGDITGIPGVVIEVKAVQEYAFNQWLTEARVERDNAGADFGLVVAKPRLVGTSKTGQWYALMYSFDYLALVSQAARTAKMDIPIWKRDMSGNSISTVVGREVKLAQAHAAEAGTSHSCVLITPKGVKDPTTW
jgi:hypothetical protein